MTSLLLVISVVWMLQAVLAFDCSAKELARYDLASIKGTHSVSSEKDTPPSKTETTWNIGICEDISGISDCKDSDLCGITKVSLDSKKYITQIISTKSSSDNVSYKPFKNSGDNNDESGILVSYDKFSWGDANISAKLRFVCAGKDDKDLDVFSVSKWDNSNLELTMNTKAACASKRGHKHEKPDNGESWGWFTWIFIFFVLFLSIYIIGGAWFQYNKGNSIDFQTALKEVVENFVEVVKGLPIFIKEILEKFTGNQNRGEYSAV